MYYSCSKSQLTKYKMSADREATLLAAREAFMDSESDGIPRRDDEEFQPVADEVTLTGP